MQITTDLSAATDASSSFVDFLVLTMNYIRDCRKSPGRTFLRFSHLVISSTYKPWLGIKSRFLGFSDSLYFNLNYNIFITNHHILVHAPQGYSLFRERAKSLTPPFPPKLPRRYAVWVSPQAPFVHSSPYLKVLPRLTNRMVAILPVDPC